MRTAAAVSAGTLVTLLHHRHGYESTGACHERNLEAADRGCQVAISEPLVRDGFRRGFALTSEVTFPLTLSVTQLDVERMQVPTTALRPRPSFTQETQLDVVRTAPGHPPVFLAFYSSSGGSTLRRTRWSEGLVAWSWAPLALSVCCCVRMLHLLDRNRLFGVFMIFGLTAAMQQLVMFFYAQW
jgi:hypothetical protein